MNNSTATPFSRPVYVMCKPAGSACNLACEYCYYLEKAGYYGFEASQTKAQLMSDATLELFIQRYIEAQPGAEVLFTWHGGETLLRPLSFYRKAMELQNKYGKGRIIENSIQTNGTLLTAEWCRFFRDNHWLVGISIDGPQEFHDEYRRYRGGAPSFQKVLKAIRLLQNNNVEWNALAVVNDFNADYPVEFYNFFRDIGCRYLQFTPVVERFRADGSLSDMASGGEITDFSVSPQQWGKFLTGVYDQWVKRDVGKIFVQLFDATLANWVGAEPGVCTMARRCGHAAVMEHNGDLYSCDHFVFKPYKLGNIHNSSIIDMMMSPRQQQFASIKEQSLPTDCLNCKWRFACNGECPRNRFMTTANGEKGLNYLCEGYKIFFEYVCSDMDFMRDELSAGRPPANIMKLKNR